MTFDLKGDVQMRTLIPPAVGVHPRRSRPRPLWPLPYVSEPTLRVALPDGTQAQLPGVVWPHMDSWMQSADASRPAPIEIVTLTRAQSNVYVDRWHDLGAETRRYGYAAFAMVVFGEVLAVATSGTTASASVDQKTGLSRLNTIELTRLCRSPDPKAKGVLRAMLRLYRDFLALGYPPKNSKSQPTSALVSYSLPGKLGGDLYRCDGWYRLRDCKPWGGGGTWSTGSRVAGGGPEALWIYPICPQLTDIVERRRRDAVAARRRIAAQAADDKQGGR